MSLSPIPLRLESLLQREFDRGITEIQAAGTSSILPLATMLADSVFAHKNGMPHLVVLPKNSDLLKFELLFGSFNSTAQVKYLPHFDVTPYSGLDPKPQYLKERMDFMVAAQKSKPGDIFVASVGGLLQKTLGFSQLAKNSWLVNSSFEFPPQLASFLAELGYVATPLVEDAGQYSVRGGILDIFPPSGPWPLRIELFGDMVDSIRSFDPNDQKSKDPCDSFILCPAREFFWASTDSEVLFSKLRQMNSGSKENTGDNSARLKDDFEEVLHAVRTKSFFPGMDFFAALLNKEPSTALEHFSQSLNIWILDPMEVSRQSDLLFEELKEQFSSSVHRVLHPKPEEYAIPKDSLLWPADSTKVFFTNVLEHQISESEKIPTLEYTSSSLSDFTASLSAASPGSDAWLSQVKSKFKAWKSESSAIFIFCRNNSQAERLKLFLERADFQALFLTEKGFDWDQLRTEQLKNSSLVHLVTGSVPESLRLKVEELIFLREEDFFGKKALRRTTSAADEFQKQAKRLSFGDLRPGDFVVHIQHGVGKYEGLKVMNISGSESEFIQVQYKENDRLYLPVYRVGQLQKFAGISQNVSLDKLGGSGWEKTKIKVRAHVRDVANELLALYAKRSQIQREPVPIDQDTLLKFEAGFPFEETVDQLKSIGDLLQDFQSFKPMDRLICGDVGFGKTEVAMRAAFAVASSGRQVAVLAPTTVLTFQHLETFKKRFSGWPIAIAAINRFVSPTEIKKVINDTKEGQVQILIGTHRLLSQDVQFKDLGLLIIDEEQKFGVVHKEKIRKMRTSVDTLAMSATPIPRTLNMSLMGVRDLSLINTPPVDRLPTRTFIIKWDEDTIRKSILSEISRGGQIYFIHNRVQSIYGLADELRQIVPEARLRVAHGQMPEHELEKAMISFFNHETDVLVCTAIVESGMDVPKANTMFIDQAQLMGLSQLYQLRGRVGRSKQRAYCYLILPRGKQLDKDAQERLKVIQENSSLGSGIRIAQYDLELRGAGDILGEDQSGHIDAVGYELYLDLLNEEIRSLKGESSAEDISVDPEINLRVPALIPDSYISDIRLRLAYYKALSEIRTEADLEKIEDELRDQFGKIPDPTLNLMGLMLIRSQCKTLGIRDLSAGPKSISLVFTDKTPLKAETVIKLAMKENKKYSLTPDQRLNVRLNNISWPAVHEELVLLEKMV